MHMRKVAFRLGQPAPPSWWLLAQEALSLWVTHWAARLVAEDAAGTPRASDTIAAFRIKGNFWIPQLLFTVPVPQS